MTVNLVAIIVAVVLLALAIWVINMFAANIPSFLAKVLYVVVVVIFVLFLLSSFGVLPSGAIRVG